MMRGEKPEDVKPRWRPLQLAFLLVNLVGMAEPTDADRDTIDLLFFPTGGGTTEAYPGLAAYTLVLRRLRHGGSIESAGMSVLMRFARRKIANKPLELTSRVPTSEVSTTRIPVASLFENLEDGVSLAEFVELFPGATQEQARLMLEHAARSTAEPWLRQVTDRIQATIALIETGGYWEQSIP
jgi:hypothetical protein